MIDADALIAGLADVTDGGASQKEELKEPFEIEVSTPAENTFFGFGNIWHRIFRQDESATVTCEIPFLPPELKAISRVADRARDEYFPPDL
jgi:hypothetical protein